MMFSKFIQLLVLIVLSLSLSGCYDTIAGSTAASTGTGKEAVSEITPTDFAGATSAVNIVTGIRITWVLSLKEASSYKVYRVQGKKQTLLGTVSGQTNSFIDGTVSTGVIYSYLVRAVDSSGLEETNNKQVQALAWAGIRSVEADSRTSLVVTFEAPSPVVDEIRVYLKRSGTTEEKQLKATISGSDLTVTLDDLRVGTKYTVSAQAYVTTLKREDGNDVTFEVATMTEGFHFDIKNNDAPKWASIVNIRAFGESLGTQVHPNDPYKQPSTRVVELAFNPFTGTSSGREYVVIRTIDDGRDIDTQTTTECRPSISSSCIACRLTSSGSTMMCRDSEVAAPPAKYLYTMAIKQMKDMDSWYEYFPKDSKDQYALRVQIPPDNMVLVHRDAANYEMCLLMNKTPDPLNHNRCPYNGIGDRPYSSGHNKPALNLPAGYYDFGYNLFVDRYPMGCKWTRAVDGGKCGPGGTSGDCISYAEGWSGEIRPNDSLGENGNVMVVLQRGWNGFRGNFCFRKINGVWRYPHDIFNQLPNAHTHLDAMYTTNAALNDGKIFEDDAPWFSNYPRGANGACNAKVDPYYGPKRINRMREYRVYSAFATLPNEPYYVPYNKANHWRESQTSLRNEVNGYGCHNDQSVAEPLPTSLAEMLQATNPLARVNIAGKQYGSGTFLGSNYTADCQSRYGVNSAWIPRVVSDYLTYYGGLSPKRMLGGVSPIDSGNRDLLKDINGLETTGGFRVELDKYGACGNDSCIGLTYGTVPYIAIPLGLPIFLSSSTDYLARPLFTESYESTLWPSHANNSDTRTYVQSVGNRWRTYGAGMGAWTSNEGGGGDWYHTRLQCVLPAE